MIVSGFIVPGMGSPETDGPPVSIALGRALGIPVIYLTDRANLHIFRALGMVNLGGVDGVTLKGELTEDGLSLEHG